MKILKLTILALIAFTVTSNLATAQSVDMAVQGAEITQTIDVKVKGVGCSTDLKTIAAHVERLEGVLSCTTSKAGATTTFAVEMTPSLITEEAIHAAIEDTPGCKNPNDRPYRVKL